MTTRDSTTDLRRGPPIPAGTTDQACFAGRHLGVPAAQSGEIDRATRYHDLDALRGFAMLLGIVLHGALSFTFLPIWPAQDIHQNSAVYGFMQHAIHGFRMPVFFLISGFFTAMMWRKRGAKGLMIHRARRILLPLIIGTMVVWPLMIAVDHWGAGAKERLRHDAATGSDIWRSAREGDLDALRVVIEEGADVNGRDSLRVSPLEWAAMYEHPEAIALLVDAGAEVNARNPDGSTALHAAAFLGRMAALRKLIDLGADVGVVNKNGDTPLRAAQINMGLVHLIAGMLRIQIDGEEVVVRRREAAAYLEALGAERFSGKDATGATAGEGGEPVGETDTTERTGSAGSGSLLELIAAVYWGATFFPVFHHLWFLYYLLWLVGMFLVAAGIWRRMRLRMPHWMIAFPGCLLWLIPLTLLPQLFMTQTFGVDTAPGLLPWPPTLVYYAIFFGFGAVCFGRREFEEQAGRHWGLLCLTAVPVLLIGLYCFKAGEGHPAAHGMASLCAVAYAWLLVFGLIGFFRRFFARESRWIRYLSDASYWLYLAHLPLIIGLQVWVSPWDVNHFPKFLLVCTLTFAILIVLYEYTVRYTFLGAGLNGRKTRPGASCL